MPVFWVGKLISFAVLLQSFELCFVPVWPWEIVSREFPRPLHPVVKFYRVWLALRLLAAGFALVCPSPVAPVAIGIMLGTTWILAVRWRGTFNGGSDVMTFQILAAWMVAAVFPTWSLAAIWYIALQVTLSYFISGITKLVRPEWRSGEILDSILARPLTPAARFFLAWATLAFECLFPLALLSPSLALAFVGAGLLFHLVNVYTLGLNRFFFAWVAGYPALYWAAVTISAA